MRMLYTIGEIRIAAVSYNNKIIIAPAVNILMRKALLQISAEPSDYAVAYVVAVFPIQLRHCLDIKRHHFQLVLGAVSEVKARDEILQQLVALWQTGERIGAFASLPIS